MTQINGFKGLVGYGIRELNSSEINLYCSNPTNVINSVPLIQSQINFTYDFMIRSYTSGCYYFDALTGKWMADGMDNFNDTNLQQTHCLSSHLTSFAGGLFILPNNFNFQYVFANASFTQNWIIYCTLILFLFLYIFFALLSIYMDLGKMKITLLKDNSFNDNYFYEL